MSPSFRPRLRPRGSNGTRGRSRPSDTPNPRERPGPWPPVARPGLLGPPWRGWARHPRTGSLERPFGPPQVRAAIPARHPEGPAGWWLPHRPLPSRGGSHHRAAARACDPTRNSQVARRLTGGNSGRNHRRWSTCGRPSIALSRPGVSRSADIATSACGDGSCERPTCRRASLAGWALVGRTEGEAAAAASAPYGSSVMTV